MKVDKPSSLFDYLMEKIGTASKNKIRRMIKSGQVIVSNKAVRRPDYMLKRGEVVMVSKVKEKLVKYVSDTKYKVLFEDDYFLAIEKPAGMIASGQAPRGKRTFAEHVAEFTQFRSKNPCKSYLVKRLDKNISGITLFAKSERNRQRMRDEWENVERRFCALIEGKLPSPEGKLEHHLERNQKGHVITTRIKSGNELAITRFKLLKTFKKHNLIELRPETGVKKQMRAQLASINCVIVGDRMYGAPGNPFNQIALHGHYLRFIHPLTKEEIKITTPYPKKFSQFAKQIK